jgi:hypothetical protein
MNKIKVGQIRRWRDFSDGNSFEILHINNDQATIKYIYKYAQSVSGVHDLSSQVLEYSSELDPDYVAKGSIKEWLDE